MLNQGGDPDVLKSEAFREKVFRFVGTTGFVGCGLGLPQKSIWYRASWSTMWKSMFDALVYGLFTADAFAWLWP